MQSCYHQDAGFSDPVFTGLNAAEVKSMWEMLIRASSDLQLDFSEVSANQTSGSARWVAHYTFSSSGKKVVNRIKAEFVFKDGLIYRHNDHFNFYSWTRQALGFPGLLLGWTPLIRNKIRASAKKNLARFMEQKAAAS